MVSEVHNSTVSGWKKHIVIGVTFWRDGDHIPRAVVTIHSSRIEARRWLVLTSMQSIYNSGGTQ